MTHKFLLSAATMIALCFGSASAFADTPWPECVNNPACEEGGCAVSVAPADATVGAGAVALAAAAAALVARRRRAR